MVVFADLRLKHFPRHRAIHCFTLLLDGEFSRPLSGSSLVSCSVSLVDVGDFRNERVIGIGVCEHGANGQ